MNSIKRIVLIPVLLCVFIFSSCGTMRTIVLKPGYDFTQIKRIAVLDFKDVSHFRNAGPLAAELFVKYLLSTGYDVIERSELDAILKEHDLAISGALNKEQIKRFGRISGVDAFVVGTVTQAVPERIFYEHDGYVRYVAAQVSITCRMISVETGEVLWAASNNYDAMDIQVAFEYLVYSVVQEFIKELNKKYKQEHRTLIKI